jgi:hypothetical protein
MLRNCRYCGRLLTTSAGTPCAHCLAEENAAVERIQGYFAAGGAATMADVARETGISMVLLRRLMREGRITLAETSGGACVLCGQALEGAPGRLCRRCAVRVAPPAGAEGGGRERSRNGSAQATVSGWRSGFYSRQTDRR